MAAPRETVWPLEPHTRAKHAILQRYLQAWMAILRQGKFPEILYIDGFAGPGQYAGGEDGSPVIALKTALGYKSPLAAKVHFLFVEKDQARSDRLREIIGHMPVPSNIDSKVECMAFEEAWRMHYPRFLRGNRLIPTFAFIDPFGWKGIPFAIVQQVMQHPNCEVFINFMYEEVNCFLSHPDQVENFDAFFGTNKWRACETLSASGAAVCTISTCNNSAPPESRLSAHSVCQIVGT